MCDLAREDSLGQPIVFSINHIDFADLDPKMANICRKMTNLE